MIFKDLIILNDLMILKARAFIVFFNSELIKYNDDLCPADSRYKYFVFLDTIISVD